MQNHLEEDDMIRINKKKFLMAALMLLLIGIVDRSGDGPGQIRYL